MVTIPFRKYGLGIRFFRKPQFIEGTPNAWLLATTALVAGIGVLNEYLYLSIIRKDRLSSIHIYILGKLAIRFDVSVLGNSNCRRSGFILDIAADQFGGFFG